MDWRHHAECRDEDPEMFFPVGTSGPALLRIAGAKTVCRRCPVNAECLNWALATGEDHGVWGGMSEDERRALKRRDGRTGMRSGPDEDRGDDAATKECELCRSPRPVREFSVNRRGELSSRCASCTVEVTRRKLLRVAATV